MMKFLVTMACALALCACGKAAQPAPVNIHDEAQVRQVVRDYLINDPEVLKDALNALADRQQQARRGEVEHDPRDASYGPADAPVTLVEFFDYRCPYCHAAKEWLFDVMAARRDVRVVFKEFPVLGPQSLEASKAAIASIPQGRYREFHARMMDFRGDLTSAAIDDLARQSGVDVARMRRDMQNPEIERILEKNQGQAADGAVQGTPAFMINGEWVHGFNRDALDEQLRHAAAEARLASSENAASVAK